MALVETPTVDSGWEAPFFKLISVDEKWCSLQDLRGEHGTVIAFICNHCPYVQAIVDRLLLAAQDMRSFGISTIAICSNDGRAYPEDSYEEMQKFSVQNNFDFPYLHDVSQDVAHAYGAVCTPDFFGFDKDLRLRYRGRLDAGSTGSLPVGEPCELLEAMQRIVACGVGPETQHPAMGCSIKWRI